MIKSPVVLIIYKRPAQTLEIVKLLRSLNPTKLYVMAEGPKNTQEIEICQRTCQIIKDTNWGSNTKIFTNYSSTNLGLKKRIVSGLNWVFEQEDQAIILEDDLVIDPSFFQFCDNLLGKYANDDRILSIVGSNFSTHRATSKYSYTFSHYTHSWGWATWKRSWKLYDNKMETWPTQKSTQWLFNLLNSRLSAWYWTRVFSLISRQVIDSWAYYWTYTSFSNNMLNIVPSINLVKNIGIGKGATHTSWCHQALNMATYSLSLPLIHPPAVRVDSKYEHEVSHKLYTNVRNILGIIYFSLVK